jgi:glutamine synthetase
MTETTIQRIAFDNVITNYIKKFYSELRIIPVLGCELEFYTKENLNIDSLTKIISNEKIKVIAEQGLNQFELILPPTLKPFEMLKLLSNAKDKLKDVALFNAKPFADQPTSSLHIHINFLDETGTNLFEKNNGKNTNIFLNSVGGLLNLMKESCVFFSPMPEDYQRYSINSMHTPSNVSWGINNRTTALRITTMEKGPRRIEHRLASSNSSPDAVVALILLSVYLGINNKTPPTQPTYGVAFDPQYALENLPKTLKEAQTFMMKSNICDLLCK